MADLFRGGHRPASVGHHPVNQSAGQVHQGYYQQAPQAQPQMARQEPPVMGQRAPQAQHAQPHPHQPAQPQQHAQPHPQSRIHHTQPHAQVAPQHQPQMQPVHHAPQAAPSYPTHQPQQASPYYAAAPQVTVESHEAGGVARAMNGLGAIMSIALIVGLGVWGYKLAMRDVTEIPVVSAIDGPMRVQPENPGGQNAEHQGLAVNNVAAEGAAEGPARQLVLAPPAETLADEDAPVVADASIEAIPTAEGGDPAPLAQTVVQPISATPEDAERAAALAMADQIAGQTAPLSGEEADLKMTPEAEARVIAAVANAAVIPLATPGIAVSPRPKSRPAALVTRAAAQPSTDALLAATKAATAEVNAKDIPAGTRLVQLGAYDSEDVARAEWDQLSGKFDEYIEGKSRVIEEAKSGGKTFYRLRAMGFEDLSDARRFCAALMAGQAACIPVVTR